jgi:hypothetical protein
MTSTKPASGSGRRTRFALLGCMALAVAGTAAAADYFPRIGLISTAGAQKYGSAFQTYAAKFQMVVIGGDWETWQAGAGYSKQSVISSIKVQSRVYTRVFQYVALNALYNSSYASSNPYPHWYNQVNARNWWLHPIMTSGTPVTDPQSSRRWLVDMGPNVPVDPSTALGPYQWGAKFVDDLFRLGHYSGTSAAPSLDGFFLDAVMIDPGNGGSGGNGDWERIGTTQAHNAPTTYQAVMAGEKSFFSYLSTAWPGSVQLGNAGGQFGAAVSGSYKATDPTVYSQILAGTAPLSGTMQGGDFEHIIGKSYAVETWGGALAMQQQYRTAMLNFSGTKLMLFSHDNVQANGSDPLSYNSSGQPASWSAAWQGARYGICAALMNNGYYFANGGNYDEETAANHRWFDEYDNAGAGVGYLGDPVGGSLGNPQTGAWSNGIWMRQFRNGIVLWNPKGNGTRTVTVGNLLSPHFHTGLRHIAGKQDTVTNNGQTVTTVTLRDRDGVILLWNSP